MSRADLHIHTVASDGVGTVKQVLAAADGKLDVIAITDHNEISGALETVKRAKKFDIQVIVGEEISTLSGHVLGLYLSEKIERGLEVEDTIRQIHKQGGLAIVPHPFPHYRGLGVETVNDLLANQDSLVHPDGVETRNGFPPQLAFYNQIHKENHKSWHLPELGGSDSHHPRSVGSCWTEFEGETAADFRQSIETNQTVPGGSGWGVLEMARATMMDATRHIKRRFKD